MSKKIENLAKKFSANNFFVKSLAKSLDERATVVNDRDRHLVGDKMTILRPGFASLVKYPDWVPGFFAGILYQLHTNLHNHMIM